MIGQNHLLIFPSEYSGIFRLRHSGQLVLELKKGEHGLGEKEEQQIVRVVTLFTPLMVRIETENKRMVRIWRDSCSEADYRHLLVVLQYLEY